MPACVSTDGGHFEHMIWTGCSCFIWHNFDKIADNWIKICSLAYVGTYNRHVKFGRKTPNSLGKSVRKPWGDFFDSHCRKKLARHNSKLWEKSIQQVYSCCGMDTASSWLLNVAECCICICRSYEWAMLTVSPTAWSMASCACIIYSGTGTFKHSSMSCRIRKNDMISRGIN